MRNIRYLLIALAVNVFAVSSFAQAEPGEIHDKYAGEIIFAGSEIDFDNMDEEFLKEEFTMDDDIYARVFIEKPLAEIYDERNWGYDFELEKFDYNYSTDIYVDGEKKISWLDELPPTMFSKNTFLDIVIVPSQNDRFRYSVLANDWVDMVEELDDGEHEVRVKFKARSVENPGRISDPLSTGSFTLVVDKNKLKKVRGNFRVGLPEPTIVDEEVEEGVVVASKNMYKNMTPVKAVIIEPSGEYQFQRDMEDRVLNRSFVAVVAFEGFDGNCYVRSARYKQDHKGNYQFDDVRLSQKLEGYLNYEVPCENIYD